MPAINCRSSADVARNGTPGRRGQRGITPPAPGRPDSRRYKHATTHTARDYTRDCTQHATTQERQASMQTTRSSGYTRRRDHASDTTTHASDRHGDHTHTRPAHSGTTTHASDWHGDHTHGRGPTRPATTHTMAKGGGRVTRTGKALHGGHKPRTSACASAHSTTKT